MKLHLLSTLRTFVLSLGLNTPTKPARFKQRSTALDLPKFVLLGLFLVTPAQAYEFISGDRTTESFAHLPTAYGDLISTSDIVADLDFSVRPVSSLPTIETVALYEQSLDSLADFTTPAGHTILLARSISGFSDTFNGPIELTYDLSGISSPNSPTLFVLDLGSGWQIISTVDNGSTLTATIFAPGIYAVGELTSEGGPIVGAPVIGQWGLIALLAGIVIMVFRMRKHFEMYYSVGVFMIIASVVIMDDNSLMAAMPEVTNPGNLSIGHMEKVKYFSRTYVRNGNLITFDYYRFKLWLYDGSGDTTDAANWMVTPPKTLVAEENALHGVFQVAGASRKEDVNGNPIPYDNETYPFFDCSGYALRGGAFTILSPIDAANILAQEYTNEGAANGQGYQVGDVVTYKVNNVITHLAKVTKVDGNGMITKLESKWGKRHIYVHGLANVLAIYGPADRVYRKN